MKFARTHAWTVALALVVFAPALALPLAACAPSDPEDAPSAPDAALPPAPDADGDGISDLDEGRPAATDTDLDGTPDYQDDDSDGDGVPDFREAGDGNPSTQPPDSDTDGLPDFRDPDADDNGLGDAADGTGDLDSDGKPDFADLDDDDDNLGDVLEMGDEPNAPVDSDADGLPDYRDVDADNDTIGDRHELLSDPDGDLVPAFRDLDADGDCRGDALEAGDADLATTPADADGDGGPDFVDLDSDNDGLKDQLEDADCSGTQNGSESSAASDDTDGDGVSDLIEVSAGTSATDANDNPQAHGDFVFLVPYQAPASPASDRLDFATAFRNVDVYFQIDVSGSMSTEISSIRNNITTVIDTLTCNPGEDPVTTGCIPDLQTGVGTYGGQLGVDPHLWHLKDINGVNLNAQGAGSTQSRLPSLADAWGNEQHLQAMGVATSGACASDATRFARACYRPNALRLLVQVTDEQYSEDQKWASNTYQGIVDSAVANDVQMIGVWSNSPNLGSLIANMASLVSTGTQLVPVLTTFMVGTPACNALGGNPFHSSGGQIRAIVQGDGASSANAITCAIQAVVRFVAQDIGPRAINDPTNVDALGAPVDAPAAFVERIETFMDASTQCPTYPQVQDSNGDGAPDVFVGLLPGKNVCWKIHVKDNLVVVPGDEPQMFRATVEVTGQGGALLDARDVFFLVPPAIPDPPIM